MSPIVEVALSFFNSGKIYDVGFRKEMSASYPDQDRLLSEIFQLVDNAMELKDTPKKEEVASVDVSLNTIAFQMNPSAAKVPFQGGIKNYLYVRKIADGGMGEVWLAEQLQPLQRVVALKLIKANLGDPQTILRFEVERQVLSMMDHENIAKIFDAGTTDLGTPYFAMEFIDGIPITQYCDQNKLTIVERLNLFVDVCGAIAHAHQQGIIHRDIKPSNILVVRQGNRHVPKVIDFGLAKAIGKQTRLADRTVFTEVGQALGTLQYMSPEQAEMNPLLIDTRTDVYALGLVLYEMLTGSPAIERSLLSDVAILQLLEKVKSAEFPIPSRRIETTEHSAAIVGAQMRIAPKRLRHMLQGDLDWIVMKAIEKEKVRRFSSVSALADDVRRFLQNEPVEARPPSRVYRIQKYLTKNRHAVLFLGTVLSLLVVGLFGTSVGMLSAITESRLAKKARDDEKTQRHIAEWNSSRAVVAEKDAIRKKKNAEALSEYLVNCFRKPSPEFGGRSVTLYETLSDSLSSLQLAVSIPPEQRSRLFYAIGRSFLELGDLSESRESIRCAVDLLKPTSDSGDAELLEYEAFQGLVLLKSGSSKEAVELLERVEIQMASTMDESEVPFIRARDYLAQAYVGVREYEKGIQLWSHLIALTQVPDSVDMFLRLEILNNLANGYAGISDFENAEVLLKKVLLNAQDIFGEDDPRIQTVKNNLAFVLLNKSRFLEAAQLYMDVLHKRKQILGEDHLETIGTQNGLARSYRALGRVDEAISLYKKSIDSMKRSELENHPDTWTIQSNLASAYIAKKDYESTIHLLAPLIDRVRESEGWGSDVCKAMLLHLSEASLATGKVAATKTMLMDFLAYCDDSKLSTRVVAVGRLRYGEIMLQSQQVSGAYEEFKKAWDWVIRLRSTPGGVKPENVHAILNRLIECSETLGLIDETVHWKNESDLVFNRDKK